MGTFERIRKMSPLILAAFAVIFIGFMVASDADIQTLIKQGNDPATAAICEINGDKILYKDYAERVNQQIEQMRSQQQNPDAEINELEIRSQVWDQMVEELLLKQEAEKVGVFVTDEEIADQLLENPPDYLRRSFTDTAGNFNKKLYLELVTNPERLINYMGKDPSQIPAEEKAKAVGNFRNDLVMIGNYLRQQKLSQGVMTAVNTAGGMISQNFASEKYTIDNSTADVNFLYFPSSAVKPEQVKVSEDEIKKYYDENKTSFKQKNQRKFKFVTFLIQPSSDDSTRSERKIQKVLTDLQAGTDLATTDSIFDIKMSEYLGDTKDWSLVQDIDNMKAGYLVNAPERQVIGPVRLPDGTYFFRLDGRRSGTNEVVKASHILINFNNNKDSAKAEAEKIMARARKGEDFAKLATELSQDKGSAAQGGDVGYFGKGKMVKPFEEACFATNPGSITGPVESDFGYHIIKVTDRKSEELKYSEIKFSPTISNSTRNKLFMDANSLAKQVEEGAPFDTVAHRLSLQAIESPFVDKTRPLMNSRALTNDIFDAELGAVLPPRDLKTYGLIVAQVLEERKEGISDLKDVHDVIKAKLVKIKQLDAVKAQAEAAYNQVKSAGTLSMAQGFEVKNAVAVKNNGVVQGVGQDYGFTANVFKLAPSTINAPVRGELGYYIIEVTNRQMPDAKTVKSALKDYSKQLSASSRQQVFYQWFQHIKETAKIDDMRSKFYQEY